MSIDRIGVPGLVGVANVSIPQTSSKDEPKEKPSAAPVVEVATSSSPSVGTRLRIEFSNEAGRFVYQSIEPATGKVLDQIPKEEVIRRLSFLREQEAPKIDHSV